MSEFLAELFKALEALQVRYCVLHGWQELPERLPSDLDIVVAPKDFARLERTLLHADGARLVQVIRYEWSSYCFVLAVQEGGHVRFLPVDVATDYRWDGWIWFHAEELLDGRRPWNGFWVASPEVEFQYLLVKKILKGAFPEQSRERLRELAEGLGQKATSIAARLLGRQWGAQVLTWIRSGQWKALEGNLRTLKRVLKGQRVRQDPLNPIRYWVPELRRIWQRWRYPTGLVVAVLGPDGSGKSALIERLEREMRGAFRRATALHLMPSLPRRKGSRGPVTDPHGKPPRGCVPSLMKLIYWWVAYWVGWFADVYPKKVRWTLVLFDRYYDDLLADPKRYRYGGPMWLARLVGRFIPKPDLFFFLDLPAEVAHARKPEVPLEEAKRLREHYLKLALSVPNVHVVDASRPLEEVVAEVEEIILRYLAARTEKYIRRLGLLG
jgi:thymidylate kinase